MADALSDMDDKWFWEGMFFRLSGSEYSVIRQAVASSPNTPPVALDVLADDTDELVLEEVARNPWTPPETLLKLARHPELSDAFLERLEGKDDLDDDLLEVLIEHANFEVVVCIAARYIMTPHMLEKLVASGWLEEVLPELEGNPHLTKDILWKMAYREMFGAVASHPNSTAELLEFVFDYLEHQEGARDVWFTGVAEQIVSHRNAPRAALELALENDVEYIVSLIARNEHAPTELRRKARELGGFGSDEVSA